MKAYEIFMIAGGIILFTATVWALLIAYAVEDPNYGSEEDEGWEIAEIEEARQDRPVIL